MYMEQMSASTARTAWLTQSTAPKRVFRNCPHRACSSHPCKLCMSQTYPLSSNRMPWYCNGLKMSMASPGKSAPAALVIRNYANISHRHSLRYLGTGTLWPTTKRNITRNRRTHEDRGTVTDQYKCTYRTNTFGPVPKSRSELSYKVECRPTGRLLVNAGRHRLQSVH